jgi:hypothetical protein
MDARLISIRQIDIAERLPIRREVAAVLHVTC